MTLSIPNILTLLRIFLIPVFLVVFYLPVGWAAQVCALVFGIASLTDWLDGYLARRLKQSSPFGAFLDPVADKLMVAAALILIVERDPTPVMAMPAVVIIGREITISALREWMAEVGARARVAVSVVGKFKTAAQMVAILMLIYREPLAGLPTYRIGLGLLYMAVLLTLWSMLVYLKAAWPTLKDESRG
jgi:CDP-diacylglycerol--glycerol-3-phosphate 3-phosphatidyltransferase